MELELKHLAPYFHYGLKAIYNFDNEENEIVSITGASLFSNEMHYQLMFKDGKTIGLFKDDFKPILRPLSDLTKDIVSESIIEEVNRCSSNDIKVCLSYKQIDFLISLHFDVFGLIEKGLAIDKTSL